MSDPSTPDLTGLFPMLQTPFAEDGSLDSGSVARLVDYLCGSESGRFLLPRIRKRMVDADDIGVGRRSRLA
jgi:hypothetical protein